MPLLFGGSVWADHLCSGTVNTVWPTVLIGQADAIAASYATTCVTSASNTALYWTDTGSIAFTTTPTQLIQEIVIDEEDLVNHAQYFALAQLRGVRFRIRTAEERRAQEELRQQAEARNREQMERRRIADAKARELLLEHLTAVQRKTFNEHGWFVVIGGKTDRRYRIRSGAINGNIDAMQGDKVEFRLCAHCSHDIPHHDQLLTQKIALTWDEDNFLRIANRHAA